MSQVSTAFDLMIARLRTLFPDNEGYFQLTNPYDIADNNVQFLRQGYGLAMGPGTNSNRELSCKMSLVREFRVVLSRSLDALEFGIDNKDASAKLLLEDAFDVVKTFEKEFRLDDDFFNTAFISDSGVQPLAVDDFSVIYLELTFNVELFDTL